MEPPLRVWRPRARPPSQADATRWLRSSAAAAPAQQAAAIAAPQGSQALSAQLQRLIAAPHTQAPRFGGASSQQPQQQYQQQGERQAAEQPAPTWLAPQPPAAKQLPRMFPAAPAQPPAAGRQGGKPAYWSGGDAQALGGGNVDQPQPAARPAPLQLHSAVTDPSVREGSNSPPAYSSAARQAIVLPPDIHACRPLSRGPGGTSRQHPHHQQQVQQQQQQQQQQPHLQQPQASMQLSRGGSGGHAGADAVSGGDLAGEVESCSPTAAELMAFVELHGLQACSIETVMQAWREQRQAARRLNSGGAAVPAWGLQQQQQPLPPPRQQAVQRQAQQPDWEQPAPTASAGRQSMGAAAAPTWNPAAVSQQCPPQQQQRRSGGHMHQHPQPHPSMPQAFLPQRHVQPENFQQQMRVQPENFQQQPQRPQAAAAAAAGGVARAAAGGSRPAVKPTSAQKLQQAVLVAGGRAYAAPDPEPPASAWERPFSAGALQNLNNNAPKQRKQQDKQKGRQPGAPSSAGERAAGPAAPGAAGAAGAAASGPAEGKKKSKLQKRGKGAAKAAAAAAPVVDPAGAAVAPDSDASDFEDGSGAAPAPGAQPPKRRKVAGKAAAAGDAGAASGKATASIKAAASGKGKAPMKAAASGKGKASTTEQLGALAEALDVVPLAGVADVCTPLGFERFACDMGKATSCSIGLLLADPQGSQFFSTLEPLTKEQQQRVKAAAAAAAAGGGGGGKKARESSKVKGQAAAVAAAAAADAGPSTSSTAKPSAPGGSSNTASVAAGSGQVVGLCVLPIHLSKEGCGRPVDTLYYVPLVAGTWDGMRVEEEVAQQGRELAGQLLHAEQSVVAFGMQGVLRLLGEAGVPIPPLSQLAVMDPRLLCWLLEPHLLQDKELSSYGLHELAERHLGGMPAAHGPPTGTAAAAAAAGPSAAPQGTSPMQRMRRALQAAIALGEAVHVRLLEGGLPMDAMQREMQVAALLAQMESAGLGFDTWRLAEAGRLARSHMARLESDAAVIAGKPFNLASPSQLADVLYTVLKLPPPAAHGRAAAKTHLPTDEAALRQLQHLSPLPGLVIQHRALQNFVSKWVEAPWAQAAAGGSESAEAWAAAHPGGGGWPRVTCAWNQTATATGRLSSSSPNLQAVTGYRLEVAGAGALTNIRDAFVAAAGCTLLSADYSQIELRVLAHLSGDAQLVQLLRRVGAGGDAFNAIASTWLGSGDPSRVSSDQREKAKRVTYGIIYGLQPWGLAQQLGVSVGAAQELISSFLGHFKGVAAYLEATRAAARRDGSVSTLAGRRRPIKGLGASDKRVRAEADRKAVNTTIQGTAADIMKAAMLNWSAWMEGQGQPPVRLVAQIHDELLLEVDGSLDIRWVAQELRRVMEGVLQLAVPLLVKLKAGERWGSMAAVG